MARITQNSTKQTVIHAISNSTIVVAGTNAVSNIASGSQTVLNATINRVWFGSDANGLWTLKRGANVVYRAGGSGYHYFDGAPISLDKTATLVMELSGSANGFILVELKKETR